MEEISARWFVQSVRKWLNRKGLTLKYKKAPRGAKEAPSDCTGARLSGTNMRHSSMAWGN